MLLANSAHAVTWQDNEDIYQIFKKNDIVGTFVVYDVSSDKLTGYNQERAKTRFTPASTFKIPNSLIGLSTGAVKSLDEIFPHNGKSQYLKEWEKDMNLREAIKVSNVTVYQEIARRVTLKEMQKNVKLLNYGNMATGNKVDRFWLDGPLKISSIEQTSFLAKLAQNQLPLSQEVQNAVQDITLLEKGSNWELHGKTGTLMRQKENIGWWVGWIKKDGHIYSFALNIDNHPRGSSEKKTAIKTQERIDLGKASLKALGLLD